MLTQTFFTYSKKALLNYKFKVALRYTVPLFLLEQAGKEGRFLELIMSTTYATNPDVLKTSGDPNLNIAYDILNGKFDNGLEFYAQQLKPFDKPYCFV